MNNLSGSQKQGLIKVLQETAKITIDAMGLNKTCLDCANFVESSEHCNIANARPPARVIVEGCSKFQNNEPF